MGSGRLGYGRLEELAGHGAGLSWRGFKRRAVHHRPHAASRVSRLQRSCSNSGRRDNHRGSTQR